MSLIENHWQHYLKCVQLKEDEMPEIQRDETKKAFMAGMGSMYVALIECADITTPIDQFFKQYKDEISEYWINERKKYDNDNNRF
ncbi:hypothetical protein JUNP353_2758 [Elizabethkingia anophelis]|nr:hypothetical protein JUNP353_2758 [Elizabethkingia anophelis]